jgi:hypothetical protein
MFKKFVMLQCSVITKFLLKKSTYWSRYTCMFQCLGSNHLPSYNTVNYHSSIASLHDNFWVDHLFFYFTNSLKFTVMNWHYNGKVIKTHFWCYNSLLQIVVWIPYVQILWAWCSGCCAYIIAKCKTCADIYNILTCTMCFHDANFEFTHKPDYNILYAF